jgi:hypothetical protein
VVAVAVEADGVAAARGEDIGRGEGERERLLLLLRCAVRGPLPAAVGWRLAPGTAAAAASVVLLRGWSGAGEEVPLRAARGGGAM